jgi:phosphoribosylformylglycinamidine synthase subunit PurQ / glutaminase
VKFGVIRFPGSCDEVDAQLAASRVGESVLLWHADRDLQGVDAIVVPGGFSYGDYLRVGAIARFAPVMESVIAFARDGGPVLGICNGFQVLCEAGLLPGALLVNDHLRFRCRQVGVEVVRDDTAFTGACAVGEILSIPTKHTTGRYYAPDAALDRLEDAGQVVLRYAAGENPNGSARAIAGVCNEGRNVVGLMPHPEHAVDELCGGTADGLKLFASAAVALLCPPSAKPEVGYA